MLESTAGNGAAEVPSPDTGAAGFDVAVTWHERIIVLGVAGTLDMVTAPQLTESILTSLTNKPAAVVVDLTEVEFLASAGMTVLIAANEEVAQQAQFAVVADGPATGRPMRLVGVDKMLTLYPTLDAAIKGLTVA